MNDIETAYQHVLDFLYSFVDYSLTRNLQYSPEKFNLTRMTALMEDLGNPHKSYPVVHVAGTKGKGSTAAMIASVLEAAGFRVGFYISPHLEEFTERIQINRGQISKEDLVRLVERLKPETERLDRLTTFELTTAAAFLYFAEQQVDFAVIEVGLGGRLDSTNVVDPVVSVITSLSMDHTKVLGDTLSKIAMEKAGIIKPGRPVVTAKQAPEAMEVVQEVAKERRSHLAQVGIDVISEPVTHDLHRQIFRLWSREHPEKMELTLPLLGQHQVENAATAFAALLELRKQGVAISDDAIKEGFASVNWPARFEIIGERPVIVLDSAHNRDSARRLRLAVDDYLDDRKVILVFGSSEDKDIQGMLAELLPRVEQVITTQSIHPRAMDAFSLQRLVIEAGGRATAFSTVEQALKEAVLLAGEEKVILVAGSLFLAGAARHVLAEA